jgi:streptomycin 3"-adenylyltransferase
MTSTGVTGSGDPGSALALEVVEVARAALGEAVLGAYLHGSAVLGGLRATSDVDVLVVIDRPMSDEQRRVVLDRLLEISGARARRGPARPVELTIVVQSQVKPWRYPPTVEFQYGEWLRDDYLTGLVPFAESSPDVAMLITMARAGNHPLFGPPPADILDPVPLDDVRQAIVAGIPGLFADLESDTRNVLLTLARIWSTLSTGEIRSKDAAAAWVIPQLPRDHRPILERARDMYLEGIDDTPAERANLAPVARATAAYIVGEIAQLRLG